MKKYETFELLQGIKAIWQEQTTDDVTLAAWVKVFNRVDLRSAKEAVNDRVRLGMDRPSAAQLYHEAVEIFARRNARTLALVAPEPTPEQKERNLQILRDAAAKIGRRMDT
jgi:hypothetical protein